MLSENEKTYKALNMLTEKYDGTLILGGSFILSVLGLIDRQVMDIDVFFHNRRKYDMFTALLADDPEVETSSTISFRTTENINVGHTSAFNIGGLLSTSYT